MIRRQIAPLLAVAVALAVSVAVRAQTANPGEELILTRIRTVYGTVFHNLDQLVRRMRAARLGWGEVIIVLQLVKLTGKSVDEITAMHKQGKGWGHIARELGVDPSDLGRAVAAVMSEGRAPDAAGKPEGTPGGAPGHPDKGRGRP